MTNSTNRFVATIVALAAMNTLFTINIRAQNVVFHTTEHVNSNNHLEIIPHREDAVYLLTGTMRPQYINGVENINDNGERIPRIQFELVDHVLNTVLLKTYCTDAEMACGKLSLRFEGAYGRKTSDGGFIICGTVMRGDQNYCGLEIAHYEGFLLKTDSYGNTQWFKRYALLDAVRFNSVIEDPATGNFIACGDVDLGRHPHIVCVNASNGNVLWAKANFISYPGSNGPMNGRYTEITTFKNGYLALTGIGGGFYGSSPNHWLARGGALLTLIDGWGNIYTDAILTGDPYGQFIQGFGISDAFDDYIVISGTSGEAQAADPYNGFYTSLIKIDPLTLDVKFSKRYEEPSGDASNALGVTLANSGGNIFVTGASGYNHWGTSRGAIYMDVDGSGNPKRYNHYPSGLAATGSTILYNHVIKAPVYSGSTFGDTKSIYGRTTLIENKQDRDCEPDIDVNTFDFDLTIFSTITAIDTIPSVTDEKLLAFDMPWKNELLCNRIRQPKATAIAKIELSEGIAISPNPADEVINIQVSQSFANGTIKIYDMLGRLMLSDKTGDAEIKSIKISGLSAGLYMLVAENKAYRQITKFVKQ